MLKAVARNRGRGVARDVKLTATMIDGAAPRDIPNISEESGFNTELSKTFQIGDRPPRTPGEISIDFGTYVKESVDVKLEWSQEPKVRKRHSKTIRYVVERHVDQTA
ncbi:hypothetical protein LG299_12460 [Microbacterium lacus]|uniref:hypothetical protein n=1 Tax=Microbacterium lacus TaxID=415217 RepID=UPI00384A589A